MYFLGDRVVDIKMKFALALHINEKKQFQQYITAYREKNKISNLIRARVFLLRITNLMNSCDKFVKL